MSLLTGHNAMTLWQNVVKDAVSQCEVTLEDELEAYLVILLNRYVNKPEMVNQIFATALLEALSAKETARTTSLQEVGDQCLLFAGLFPHAAERRQVKVSYYVDIGRSAYAGISHHINDLYGSLAVQFVLLMDVLQSIRPARDLLPMEAYDQWQAVGSDRARKILQRYADIHITPFRK